MVICFCMTFNCRLSLSCSPLLVQYCVSSHRFQYFYNYCFSYTSAFFLFSYSPLVSNKTLSSFKTHSPPLVPFVSCIFPIFHLCLSLSSQHSFISSLHLPKGPFFRFQTYVDWLKQPSPQALPGLVPCLERLKLVPVYGALFLAVNSVFPLAYVRTEEFVDENFFFRYCYSCKKNFFLTCD